MSKPNLKTLEEKAAAWNEKHDVGTPVIRYKLIDPLREGTVTRTRSGAWVMGGHSVMVKVEGVSGGVLLDSVNAIATPAAGRYTLQWNYGRSQCSFSSRRDVIDFIEKELTDIETRSQDLPRES
jgi:hypothetical protein